MEFSLDHLSHRLSHRSNLFQLIFVRRLLRRYREHRVKHHAQIAKREQFWSWRTMSAGRGFQNLTGGPCHVAVRGRARAIACSASHQPSQALRPGRRRQKLSKPLHFE